jgi:hypothetical protein
MNGDGHRDVLIGHGWWQNPGDILSGQAWAFHPVRVKTPDGESPLPAVSNIYADDLDQRRRHGSVCGVSPRVRCLVG